ncbi:glycosyltransferase family 4 protein [Chloroflexota bacterium]
MKVVFVSSGLLGRENYGSEYQMAARELVILGISRELTLMGHEVFIIRRGYKSTKSENVDGIHIVSVNSSHLRDERFGQVASAMLFSLDTSKMIKKINPDIVFLSDRYSGYFPSKLKIPKIFIANTHDVFGFVKNYEFKRNKLNHIFFYIKRKVEEDVMRRCEAIVPPTESIKDYLIQRGIANVHVIPSGINVDDYFESEDDNFILFAGRLVEHKGIQYLISAFSKLTKDYEENLVILGSGPLEKTLKELVITLNLESRVKFVPFLSKSKYRELLSKCKVFAFPSLYEAFGVVVIEAMASSKPVITTNTIGPKDIITHGQDGLLFESQNEKELKYYLESCLDSKTLRREIGKAARITVESKYSFHKIANQYLRLYEKIS